MIMLEYLSRCFFLSRKGLSKSEEKVLFELYRQFPEEKRAIGRKFRKETEAEEFRDSIGKSVHIDSMEPTLQQTNMEKKKELQTKLVFADVFRIKTETEFNVDGTLTVIPINWSEGDVRLSTPSGKKPPKIYGKMEYTLSGKAVFCPSKQTDKPRYNVLYSDKFLQIKETDKDMIFKIQAAKGYFATEKYAKPVIQSFDWAKTFIKDDIKARKNHGSKQNLLQGR